jgi:hypothetical protein
MAVLLAGQPDFREQRASEVRGGAAGHVRSQGVTVLIIEHTMLKAAGIADRDKSSLFRSAAGKTGILTDRPMRHVDAYQMVRRRTAEPGLEGKLGCHVFRATGSPPISRPAATLENTQAMAPTCDGQAGPGGVPSGKRVGGGPRLRN